MTDTALDHAPLACLDTLLRQNPDLDPGALTVAQARTLLIRWVPSPAGQEPVPLAAAHHRVLATELRAPFDQPPHDHAAMDGYAVRHADLATDGPTKLPVAGRTLAGDAPATLPPGQAWRIMTGAVMPAGADTVIMQEQVRTPVATPSATFPPRITIPPGQQPGQNVRRRGEDLQQGAVALPAGTLLSAVPLGVAASLGLTHVPVFRPLRVGVFSTGNELVQGDQPRAAGQIHDSNRPTLLALMAERGWQALDLGALPDDPARLGQALQQAARRVDVLLTSGGAAGGDADLLHPVLSQLAGGQAHALRLRLRPGRPLLVGRIGQTPLFGLPGNPVAATLSFLLVVQDALHTMAGTRMRPLPQIRARLGVPLGKRPGRMELVRVRLAGPGPADTPAPSTPAGDDVPTLPVAHPTGNQSSALLRSLFEADGITVLPEAQGPLAAGDLVDVMPLRGLLAG